MFPSLLVLAVISLHCLANASDLTKILVEKAHLHKHELSGEEHYDKEGHHNLEYDHEIFLGLEKKKFDKLTPEKARKRLRTLVKKIDTDEDGFVTVEEMRVWVKKVFHEVAARDAKIMFRKNDEDKDGKVTWEEYKKQSFSEDELNDEDPPMQQLLRSDKRNFDMADEDKDGFISTVREGKLFVHPELSDRWDDMEAINIIDESDENGDLKMNLTEFLGPIYANPGETKEPDWVKGERDLFNNVYDMNKDGQLDKDEVKKHFLKESVPFGQNDAAHLVKAADDDQDSKLSVDEIVRHHDFFVGSHVTDYGRALPFAGKHDEL